ncbi:ABC transporter permease [Salinigranum marinum]|uniref:ABC transporter permease n=1 Tax=Salinigranum marinum TaxID=1515595 RepID=UPI002989AA0E|nr:ABC transporter permease [Salinigranum marinum]
MTPRPRRTRVWRSFRSHPPAVAGLAVVAVVTVVGVVAFVDDALLGNALVTAVWHSPFDPAFVPLAPPSPAHPFGTDSLGRDVLARTVYGAKVSVQVALTAVVVAAVVGSPLGIVAGYAGGTVETVLMRLVDVLLGFPALVLAIGLVAALGFSLTNVVIALGVVYVPQFARIARSSALSVSEEEYVDAARVLGYSRTHIVFREVLPNSVSPLLVQASLLMAFAIIAEASLSFLGLGVQPPTPTWGAMVSAGSGYLTSAPWISLFPGGAIFLSVLGFNLVGDGLRDALDPRDVSERRF